MIDYADDRDAREDRLERSDMLGMLSCGVLAAVIGCGVLVGMVLLRALQ